MRRDFGRGVEDEFEILAKAHVEHLVGLVEHHCGEARRVKGAAFDMVAQPAWRADDDMGACLEGAALGALVHAADAGNDARAGVMVEPLQFAGDLQRQFARRRDDERERRGGVGEFFAGADQLGAHGEAEGHGLAGAGLGGNENVAPLRLGPQHGGLDRGGLLVVVLCERAGQRRAGFIEGQLVADLFCERRLAPPYRSIQRRWLHRSACGSIRSERDAELTRGIPLSRLVAIREKNYCPRFTVEAKRRASSAARNKARALLTHSRCSLAGSKS